MDLDVVRGVAILLAIGWHLNAKTGTALDWVLIPGARFGWAGVDLFFVLSGFLVGRMLFKERARTGRVDLRVFYIRRILRLWPVMYVFLVAMLLLTKFSYKTYFFQIALHVQDYWRTPVATHLWSLAVEEQFYVVFSLALILGSQFKASNQLMVCTLVATLLFAFAFRLAAAFSDWDAAAIQMQFQFRMDALAAGVLLAFTSINYPSRFDKLLMYRVSWASLAVIGFSCLAFIDKASRLGETLGFSISWIASSSLLLAVYRSGIEIRAVRTCRILAFFGLISYPLYLWHVPAARVIGSLLKHTSPVLLLVADYLGAVLIATIVRLTIEVPILLWRDRRTPARAIP